MVWPWSTLMVRPRTRWWSDPEPDDGQTMVNHGLMVRLLQGYKTAEKVGLNFFSRYYLSKLFCGICLSWTSCVNWFIVEWEWLIFEYAWKPPIKKLWSFICFNCLAFKYSVFIISVSCFVFCLLDFWQKLRQGCSFSMIFLPKGLGICTLLVLGGGEFTLSKNPPRVCLGVVMLGTDHDWYIICRMI